MRRHPWVFSGAIASLQGEAESGDVVDVFSARGIWLARAAYSSQSQISARVLSWNKDLLVDSTLVQQRLRASIERRSRLRGSNLSNAWREVFSESDGLPGLVVDNYAGVFVIQLTTAWADRQRDLIIEILSEIIGCRTIFERSDGDVRKLEGLDQEAGWLWGDPVDDELVIEETGSSFIVDIERGHKTGYYLDQRQNRLAVSAWAPDAQVLDAFCYSGGFGIKCLTARAQHVTFLDSSPAALEMVDRNLKLNNLEGGQYEFLRADVFEALRSMRDRRAAFDLIILDPPKFAATSAQVGKASRAYKDINLLALKLLRPGGFLATFSCSGGLPAPLFQKIVADAALDSGVTCRIIRHFEQDADHPVELAFPESSYLKGLLVQVD